MARSTARAARRAARARGARTGVVSENMQGLGAKLRKLAGQAKICTPPGGEVIAKICNSHMCSDLDTLRPLATGSPHFFLSPPSGGGYVSQRWESSPLLSNSGLECLP